MWTKYIKLERQILDQEKGLVDIHKGSSRSYLELSRSYIGATFFQGIGCWLCSLSYLLPVGLMLSVFCGSTSFRGASHWQCICPTSCLGGHTLQQQSTFPADPQLLQDQPPLRCSQTTPFV